MARLLVVCKANICRSPLIEHLLRVRLAGIAGFEDVRVVSAGVDVTSGHRMCELAAAEIGNQAATAPHRARGVTQAMLDSASLVLTAGRAERSALAKLSPESRTRVFTLKEAVALAGTADQPLAEQRTTDGGADRLADLATHLNARRGLLLLPTHEHASTSWWPFTKKATDPLEIPDGHNLGDRAHRATIRNAHQAVDQFVALLERPRS